MRDAIRHEKGFTLIELLIVVLIIGILAAIAIPSFVNQRGKANDASAKSAVRTARVAMEIYAIEHAGEYSGCNSGRAPGDRAEARRGAGRHAHLTGSARPAYTLTVTSESGGRTYTIARAGRQRSPAPASFPAAATPAAVSAGLVALRAAAPRAPAYCRSPKERAPGPIGSSCQGPP